MYRNQMPARGRHQWLVGKENDGPSSQAAGLAALQLTLWIGVLWHTCRIIMWCVWLVGSKVGMSGCTWVTVRGVVRSSVESTLNVFLVFCVLVECARFGRQQGHVVTESVQWSAVTRGGRLTELLCHLCKVKKRFKKCIRRQFCQNCTLPFFLLLLPIFYTPCFSNDTVPEQF